MAKLEAQSAELDRQAEEFSSDYQKLMDIQQQKDALDEELLALYERWEELNA
ncbi:MAG: ABC transporter C-terminal domain-containing protein [Oscillospiraceae bacterium]